MNELTMTHKEFREQEKVDRDRLQKTLWSESRVSHVRAFLADFETYVAGLKFEEVARLYNSETKKARSFIAACDAVITEIQRLRKE